MNTTEGLLAGICLSLMGIVYLSYIITQRVVERIYRVETTLIDILDFLKKHFGEKTLND